MDVWIIGGGLAGLTAGVALSRQGVKVGVLEAAPRLGGRAQCWKDPSTGEVIDLGPHVLLSTYPHMKAFLEACGTSWEDAADWQSESLIDQMDGDRAYPLTYAPVPAPFHFVPSLLRMPGIRFPDLYSQKALLSLAISTDNDEVMAYDSIPASELLKHMGVSDSAVDHLWRFIALSILNVPLEECSSAAFLRFARFLMGRRDFRIGFPKAGLGDLFAEGATRIIREAGGEVRVGARVERLERRPDGGFRLHVSGQDTAIEAEQVLCALSPQDASRLLGTLLEGKAWAESAAKLEPCPYVSLYLKFDRKVTRRRFWARMHREGDLNCDFYDLSNIRPGDPERPSFVASNIIYSHRVAQLSEQELIDRTLAEIRENIPGARDARVVSAAVNRIPMAIHCPKPGAESLRPEPELIPGRLLVAGDWIRTHLPSSMESACASGWTAAELLLQSRGLRPREFPVARWLPPLPVRAQAAFWSGLTRVKSHARTLLQAPRAWEARRA